MAPHLTEVQIKQAQNLRCKGYNYRKIATELVITYCQAYHACRRKGLPRKTRSGRPPKLGKEEVNRLLTFLKTDPSAQEMTRKEIYTLVRTQWHWNVCEMTVRRVLQDARYCAKGDRMI